jgi:DNA-binding LacI/PurR family transcriptional regulator
MDLHENNANGNQIPDLRCLPSLCRGIYNRVAQKVGCDPSYVSRVARGERTSQVVSEALRAEIQLAWTKLAHGAPETSERAPRRKTRAASA